VTLILDQQADVNASASIAAALLAVAIGCLVGTLWGNAGGLVGLGLLLTVALLLASAVPSGRVGQQVREPQTLAGLQSSYRHGVGQFELDLSGFDKPSQLAGRTIRVDAGVGQTIVYVPEGLPVKLDAQLRGGEINLALCVKVEPFEKCSCLLIAGRQGFKRSRPVTPRARFGHGAFQ
jgi:hypothetical protein